MSIGTVKTIIDRIKVATVLSPIAVFKETNDEAIEVLNAVFADTVETRKRIANNYYGYIGTFDRTMNMADIRKQLRQALDND